MTAFSGPRAVLRVVGSPLTRPAIFFIIFHLREGHKTGSRSDTQKKTAACAGKTTAPGNHALPAPLENKNGCSHSVTKAVRTPATVRITGLEPARRGHWTLKPARLPIPPYPHLGRAQRPGGLFSVTSYTGFVNLRFRPPGLRPPPRSAVFVQPHLTPHPTNRADFGARRRSRPFPPGRHKPDSGRASAPGCPAGNRCTGCSLVPLRPSGIYRPRSRR